MMRGWKLITRFGRLPRGASGGWLTLPLQARPDERCLTERLGDQEDIIHSITASLNMEPM